MKPLYGQDEVEWIRGNDEALSERDPERYERTRERCPYHPSAGFRFTLYGKLCDHPDCGFNFDAARRAVDIAETLRDLLGLEEEEDDHR